MTIKTLITTFIPAAALLLQAEFNKAILNLNRSTGSVDFGGFSKETVHKTHLEPLHLPG